MEILGYAFVRKALIAGTLSGVLLAVIGVYVVLKKMSFIGDGIAHSAFGGIALGLLIGVNTTLAAVVFAWVIAMLIGISKKGTKTSEDALIGIFFAFTMALGVIFIGFNKSYNADIFGYLFGDILAVTDSDVWVLAGVTFAALAVIWYYFKELMFFTFDEEGAQVSGIDTNFIYFLLLTLISVTVVVSIKIVGIILAVAFLIIPVSCALLLTRDFKKMMALSAVISVVSTLTGFAFSYIFNLASGATIVVTATFIFAVITVGVRVLRK
ncbi:MAG: metal ABC transporter permease [Spirochaetia bacterium]|nr:metal ABC transporter permease [Spirochaetia bacterium]